MNRRRFGFHAASITLLTALLPALALAAWPGDPAVNVPVCTAANEQVDPKAVSDGGGGAIIAWLDGRTGNLNIYVQHVLADGAVDPAWPAGGRVVSATSGSQSLGTIISDDAGGAVVIWADGRSGSGSDIYAQHVLASGSVDLSWPAGGQALCTAAGDQVYPSGVSDPSGSFIVTWEDRRDPTDTSIYAQHLISDGEVDPGWPVDGLAICTEADSQERPTIVSDGAGGAIIAWQDLRAFGYWQVFAYHVLGGGVVDTGWPLGGRALGTAAGHQQYPRIISDGAAGAIVAWSDHRGATWDIYAQHVLSDGVVDPAWPAGGRALCAAVGEQGNPAPVPDGAGGVLAAWYDYRAGATSDIYAQHLLANGVVDPAWPADGRALCTAEGNQDGDALVSDGAGGAIAAWMDVRGGTQSDIYAQHVLSDGAVDPAWPADGRALCTASGNQDHPAIVPDGTGGAIVTWQDYRGGSNYDIYTQGVDRFGQLGSVAYTLSVSASGSGYVVKSPNKAEYDQGTTVTLTAIPAPGATFVGWGGDASGSTNPLTVTMDGNKTITATFTIVHTLTATAGPGGSISPSGQIIVEQGANQAFMITADAGYHIGNVIVDGVSQGAVPSYGFPDVSSDHTIAVMFGLNAQPSAVRGDLYVTNGAVKATALAGNTLYLGGTFSEVGYATGSGVPIDGTTGFPSGGFPKVAGTVSAVAPDGYGGWYIGGQFTGVGGAARSNLAHVLPDLSVSGWNPGTSGSWPYGSPGVYAIAVRGATVFVGGSFTSAGGQPRNYIAALDATTGLATGWTSDFDGPVLALAATGTTLYVGGDFLMAGGTWKYFVAALDPTTGYAKAWDPSANGTVRALAVDGPTVYVGGDFTYIGGTDRNYIAALDATTGLATAWSPFATEPVRSLALGGTVVYAAGDFTDLGGQVRHRIGAVDATTGLATPWNPDANGTVAALAVSGTTVIAGGDFTSIGGQTRSHIAALDGTTGLATAWSPSPNGRVAVLAVDGPAIFAGGTFTSMGGLARNGLAAMDVTTGQPTGWNPNVAGTVNALALHGSTIYVGGTFGSVGVEARGNLAAIDATTGLATAWNPGATASVYALAVSGGTVYVGGDWFSSIGGQMRSRLAALDAVTGLATPWDPNAEDGLAVYALAVRGTTIYAGGAFQRVAGQARYNIAALDSASGMATPWDPGASDRVFALSAAGTTVYAGGWFGSIGGQARDGVAALDATTGLATAWHPGGGGRVYSLAVRGTSVYVGGEFTDIGGQPRSNIAELGASTGAATGWNPGASGPVYALTSSGTAVYAGGDFSAIGNLPQSNLASVADTCAYTLSVSVTGSGSVMKSPDQPTYGHGGGVGLTATPAEGASFLGWTGDVSDSTNPILVTMDANKSITANFSTVYTVRASAGPGGSITPSGSIGVPSGADQTFTVTPDPGYHVVHVIVDGVSQGAVASYMFNDVSSDHAIAAVFGTNPVTPPGGEIVRPDFYVANGPVVAEALSGNTLYIGGVFSWVGPATGGGIPIEGTSGTPISGFPKVTGAVETVIPDGLGGWYIGGRFTSVGGLPRTNLAHVLSDNSVGGWNPGADTTVSALVLSGRTVYAGGVFTNAGGAARNHIAALDATTGLATTWDPNADGTVRTLSASGTTVYAGGDFTDIGGQARNRIAALDAATGLATAWDANASHSVNSLVSSGATVYAGGEFTGIGGQARRHIAALDAATGLATAWDPSADTTVTALALGGTVVYAGGAFTNIGGQARNHIAALDAATGLATPWNPDAGDDVLAIAVSGSTVYVGGYLLPAVGGQARDYIAALDGTTGLATDWNPKLDNAVHALAVSGSTVYAGGPFTSLGGEARRGLAALNATTGIPTAWDPEASGPVMALAARGTTVYVGGAFGFLGGQVRRQIGAVDSATGLVTDWNPGLGGLGARVNSLAVSGGQVYVGGKFTSLGGQARNSIAAVDSATGLATDWDPNANFDVYALAVSGTTVYAGGLFSSIGGAPRENIAALDSATGLATPWNPNANGQVLSLLPSGGRVYACGAFTSIGGQARNRIAALDAATGLATAWDPNPDGGVSAMALGAGGGTLYAGGFFQSIGGQARSRIAALDATTGLATDWSPNPNQTVRALAVGPTAVYAGGLFTSTSGLPQSYLACLEAMDRSPALTLPRALGGEEKGTITFTVQASDADGDAISSLSADLSRLPSGHGATFTVGPGNTSGTFLWNPGAGKAGTYPVAFTAANALGVTDTTWIMVVPFGSELTGKLEWKTKPSEVGDYVVAFKAVAVGPPREEKTATTAVKVKAASGAGRLEREASLAPLAGQKGPIISAPATAEVMAGGTLVVEVTASGADSLTADLSDLPPGNSATFTVDYEPQVVAPGSWSAERGAAMTFVVTASDPDGDAILGLTADLTRLPVGNNATFVSNEENTSGTFSWTPAVKDSGAYVVSFKAANALVRYAATVITVRSGLVGYWKLNGNGADEARGNALTAVGDVTYPAGRLNQGADFGGGSVGTRLTGTATSDYNLQAGFTVQFWVKVRSYGIWGYPVLLSAGAPAADQWSLYLCGVPEDCTVGTVQVWGTGASGNYGLTSVASVGDGSFHHVALTYDGAVLRLIVDGVEDASLARAGLTSVVGGTALSVGATETGEPFDGVLDEVRIYRVARSAAQIQGDMNRELGFPTGVGSRTPAYVNRLGQNRPNPFNPETTIGYELEEAGRVTLTVFDARGRLVERLVDEVRPAGRYAARWNGTDAHGRSVASGVYFYRLETSGFKATRRMVLLK